MPGSGVATRVHGGLEAAPAPNVGSSDRPPLATSSFDFSRGLNVAAKRAIAQAAVALCEDGEAIIINGGTTTFEMAVFLRERHLKVLTNSYPLAETLIHDSKCRVALPGGEVYREQKLIVSPFEEDAIQHYSASRMFMSAIAIGPLGVIEGDPLIARAETKLLKRADKPHRACGQFEIRLARQPRGLPVVPHQHSHHRSRRAARGARNAQRIRRPDPIGRRRTGDRAKRARSRLIDRRRRKQEHAAFAG